MPRDIPVGNGNLLIAFDKSYLLRDFYFPHVGQENHTGRDPFRMGVWCNGEFSWIPKGWKITLDYLDDSMATDVELVNEALGLKIHSADIVDFHDNVYLRKMTVINESSVKKDVRIFMCQDFHIYGNDIGDTAAYRPDVNGVLHYKDKRYFLINIFANKKHGVDLFATGVKEHGPYEGAWKDAEDGVLSGNAIAQGAVDSVIGIPMVLEPGESDTCYYWISVGTDWNEVRALNEKVRKKTPEKIFKRTFDYWRLWVNKEGFSFELLPERLIRLYKRSLLVIRTQIDNCGSIVAANDSDVIKFNRDTYSYMWPRDGALTAYALDLAGFHEITRRFFNHCARIIEKEGYFLHKYNPSGSPASSWHPWIKGKTPQLPIQEDETALVIWALWKHFELTRDVEFIKPLYRPLIKNAADMMMDFRDGSTGLPLPSYDLWEERQGILTFTSSAVYGGLKAAAGFARAFGEETLAEEYERGAGELRRGMDRHLYLAEEKRFARMVTMTGGTVDKVDSTVDASLAGIFGFGAYDPDDEMVKNTMAQVHDKLLCRTDVGGIARYEGDEYYRRSDRVPGNPWFVTTLWMAWYYIASAKDEDDIKKAMTIMEWVAERALKSGVLAEQVDPITDEPLSVSPLTWSHATFVGVVHEYLNKFMDIKRCAACGHPIHSK
ncbi:MAG: glycoside hydrolase family 15 protein [Thermodesulfobacteriota bacterium]|nr:MAG: glycoside hydrolase family 15 protein [Thermodesulfobacteriota bacterium]